MSELLNKLESEVRANAQKYVDAFNKHERKPTLKTLKSAANEACKNYNLQLEKECYQRWANEGNPVLTAIRTGDIQKAIRLQFKTDDDNIMACKLVQAKKPINLYNMHETLGEKIFHDPKWYDTLEQIVLDVGNSLSQIINGTDTLWANEYKTTSGLKVGEAGCDEEMISRLQEGCDAIVFIPDENGKNQIQAGAAAWAKVRECMTHKGKERGEVEIVNVAGFADLVVDAMNVVLNDGEFKLIAQEPAKSKVDKKESKPEEKKADGTKKATKKGASK